MLSFVILGGNLSECKTFKMATTMIRSKVKYKKISNDDDYIDAQVCDIFFDKPIFSSTVELISIRLIRT